MKTYQRIILNDDVKWEFIKLGTLAEWLRR